MYLHGGGFVLGSLDSGDQIASGIAQEVGAVVVSVDYRLAPEDPFPAAPEDCHAALAHVSRNAAEFGIDPERIAIWGDSAGGNLSVATCMLARDRGGPRVAAQAVIYPTLIDRPVSRSHREHADSPGLGADFMERAWNAYLGKERGEASPYATPLSEGADLTGLPPAHVHIAHYDPLADDGRDYVRRLLEAGVDAELHVRARHDPRLRAGAGERPRRGGGVRRHLPLAPRASSHRREDRGVGCHAEGLPQAHPALRSRVPPGPNYHGGIAPTLRIEASAAHGARRHAGRVRPRRRMSGPSDKR